MIIYGKKPQSGSVLKVYDNDRNEIEIPAIMGKGGYSPVKNVDYFTEADKAEMVSAVISALPRYNGEVEDV